MIEIGFNWVWGWSPTGSSLMIGVGFTSELHEEGEAYYAFLLGLLIGTLAITVART